MERENYEKLTKAGLIDLCKENDILYKSKMRKAEIIDLLIDNTSPKPKKPPSRQKKNAKPSVLAVIPMVQSLLDSITKEMAKPTPNKLKCIENAEQLKEVMKDYDFEAAEVYEKDIKLKIGKVVDYFEFDGYSAVNHEKKKINIKMNYKDPKVSFRDGKLQKKLTITYKELCKEIRNSIFISNFASSVRELMNYKTKKYTEIKKNIEDEIKITDEKVRKLKASGTTDRVIEDMYPQFNTMKAFKLDLEDLIALTRRKSNVDIQEIKNGLFEALKNEEFGLACIKGRNNVKNKISAQIYSFSKGYKTFVGSFNNIAIYGPSGSGKTYMAQVLGFVFSKIGILAKNNVKIVTKADLVGQYVGHTAPRTRASLIETLEGILFIDEAYQLSDSPAGGKDYGKESLAEMINFIDKYIGLNIVIVAGYEGKMRNEFMTYNEGLPRRFPFVYVLEPYSNQQLTDILIVNLTKKLPSNVDLDEDICNYIYSLVVKLNEDIADVFKNQAGDMLNLASSLNKTIISSYKIPWAQDTSTKDKKSIIIEGFNDYLDKKNIYVSANN